MASKSAMLAKRGRNNRSAALKNVNNSHGYANNFPCASDAEGCVVVPFTLAACIPECAVRKFAAKKPFSVHINDGIKKCLVLYGDEH
jgi:hypothetical protein